MWLWQGGRRNLYVSQDFIEQSLKQKGTSLIPRYQKVYRVNGWIKYINSGQGVWGQLPSSHRRNGLKNSFFTCQASPGAIPLPQPAPAKRIPLVLPLLTAWPRLKCKSHLSASDWPDLSHIWHPCYTIRESLGDVVFNLASHGSTKGHTKRKLEKVTKTVYVSATLDRCRHLLLAYEPTIYLSIHLLIYQNQNKQKTVWC